MAGFTRRSSGHLQNPWVTILWAPAQRRVAPRELGSQARITHFHAPGTTLRSPPGKATTAMPARQISRRALARTAVWAVPTVALSVAAPAVAASRCTQQTLEWSRFGTDGSGKREGTASFMNGTATLSRS